MAAITISGWPIKWSNHRSPKSCTHSSKRTTVLIPQLVAHIITLSVTLKIPHAGESYNSQFQLNYSTLKWNWFYKSKQTTSYIDVCKFILNENQSTLQKLNINSIIYLNTGTIFQSVRALNWFILNQTTSAQLKQTQINQVDWTFEYEFQNTSRQKRELEGKENSCCGWTTTRIQDRAGICTR